MRNIVIISSSLRNGSNSEIMAKELMRAASINNDVSYISLKDFNLKFCLGCLACQKTGRCIINDDINENLELITNADVLVLATPIYFYGMSGQLKTFLDRMNPLYIKKNRFKEVYLLASCADDDKSAIDRTITGVSGFIDCFNGLEFKGYVLADSTNAPKSLKDDIKIACYELGINL